jgi:methylenetetrahydrofolate dehydrogenase (NADP+)/methenyltetrahydrofolate cyclohydrolase
MFCAGAPSRELHDEGGHVPAVIIDGKAIGQKVRDEVRAVVVERTARGLRAPGLATVLVGADPASHVYVRNKRKTSEEAGFISVHHELPATTTTIELLALVHALNGDDSVDGILVQLPLPKHVDAGAVLVAIAPHKDVDGFHPENVARLTLGMPGFVPCTPLGCLRLLDEHNVPLRGARAVVVGRSHIVGKPMAELLLARDATVTIAHSKSRDLAGIAREADVLVVAVGRARMIGASGVKPGAVVIDVGMNRDEHGKLCGDVDTAAIMDIASAVTPVPGGVGPMTIAMLLQNTLRAHGAHTEAKPS